MIIGNFTPDAVEWMHIGITGTIEPGETVEMDDSRAKHVLNAFARRGLVQLRYGDELEGKKAESMAQWTNFWEQQIVTFNQHNEDQKEKGNRYARPTKELEAHAKILKLELLQPFRIKTKDESPELAVLREENVALKATVDTQTSQINQILEMIKSGKVLPAAPEESAKTESIEPAGDDPLDVVAANRKKYISLSANTMPGWLKNNWEEYQEMPEENRFEIKTRYEDLCKTPFPEEKPA